MKSALSVLGSQSSVQRSEPLNRQPAPSAHVPSEAPLRAPSDEPQPSTAQLEEMILHRLDEDKAQDIVVIDLKDKSSVADTMIVVSGRSHRHVGALADHILRLLKEAGQGKARVEGLP